MIFAEQALPGVYLVTLKEVADERGFFARGWCQDEFARHGLDPGMTQLNIGFSPLRGTLRGLHFQRAPHGEAKFVRCTRGSVFDVAVDLRQGSPTLGRWLGVELREDGRTALYVPQGFAHGYQTLTDDAEVHYMTTARYAPSAAGGVRFDDPAFGIAWPLPVSVISAADRTWPDFSTAAALVP